MKSKIVVHCLVKNEEKYIWYCLNSVLKYVDLIMVWDTGSSDKTVEIVKLIKSPKIQFRQVGEVDENTFTMARNKMIQNTPKGYSWLMILDGDEIWSDKAIKAATDYLHKSPNTESVVVRTYNLVGDVYHRLPESAGHYQLAGRKGHLNLRFINLKKVPKLNVRKPHGQQGYYDSQGQLVQNRNQSRVKFLDLAYFHATHLVRSETREKDKEVIKRAQKLKYELGIKIRRSDIPEVFFKQHPTVVPSVIQKAPLAFWLISLFQTLPKRLKRIILHSSEGY